MIVEKIDIALLQNDKRFEARYYLNEYAATVRHMVESNLEFDQLCTFGEVFNPSVFKRQYCDRTKTSIPYRQSSDLTKHYENPTAFLPSNQVEKLKLAVQENWILITGFGTIIGDVALVDKNYANNAFANNVCRFIPNDSVKFGFICAFLKSKYGKAQFNKNASGSTIRYIEAPVVKRTLVPRLSDNIVTECHNLILKANEYRNEANDKLNRVNQLLKEYLGIEKTHDILTSSTESTTGSTFFVSCNSLTTKTLRARNYSPRKQKIIDSLKSVRHEPLKSVLLNNPSYGARFKRISSAREFGVELLSQSDIFSIRPSGRIISRRSFSGIDKEIVSRGTILIPAQGTLGENEIFAKAKFVWGYLENKLVAGHVMRFHPNEERIAAGYLYAILSSPLWFRLLRASVFGTNLLGFITDLLLDYPIPRFSKEREATIDALVKGAYDLFTEANKFEELAISMIEKEIDSWQK